MAMADLTKQISTLVAALAKLTQVGTSSEQHSTDITKLADAISTRIPMFVYEPEDGRTFKSWCSQYKVSITKDGSLFQGAVQTRKSGNFWRDKHTKNKASIRLKLGAQPVFRKARPVPYATLPTITEELYRSVQKGIATPIDYAQWAALVVKIRKKNGSFRMYANFSTGLNGAIEPYKHPFQTVDAIFTKLNGGKHFSQIDLAEAYFQIELDEDSKNMLCINTYRGFFQLNRLQYGVKPLSKNPQFKRKVTATFTRTLRSFSSLTMREHEIA
uniref:DUF7083 domain-containing protein n=1 Tax=Caenorhabditis japonica TaxID=281687 RepID=A0A8R1I940_CAEJA